MQNKHPMITRGKAGIHKPRIFTAITNNNKEPTSYLEALQVPEWKEVMEREYAALMKNKTWSLSHLPPDKKLVGCKWVLKLKRNANGFVARYKARLVAKGYTQMAGFDYT